MADDQKQMLKDAVATLRAAIAEDVAQDKEVVRLVNLLIEKVKALPGAVDLTEDIANVIAATNDLSGDNADVQKALDDAGTVSA